MKILLSYTRSTFWTIGVITGLFGLVRLLPRHAATAHHAATKHGSDAVTVTLVLVMISFGVLTCLAARALRRQGRFAKTLVAFASIYSLLIFPFGTVAGVVGLYWCFSRKMRNVEPLTEPFDYQSKKGDGTQKWMQMAVSVASIVIMLGSLAVAHWWGQKQGLPRRAAINGLILLFLCEWIAAFFHELGHAIAGYVNGMRLVAFSVGPFLAHKKANKWKFGFTLGTLIGAGGSVATVPLHLRNLRRRMAVEIAAGPIASLLTAVIAMGVLAKMPHSAWEMWWKVPAVVAAISAGAVLLNLIPFRSAAGFSDGALLAQLLVGGPFADMREALKAIGATSVSPLRPRDVDAAVLSRGVNASAGEMAGTGRILETICAVDRGDLTCARACLDSALETLSTPEKVNGPGGAAEMAFYLAYLDGHAGRASQWLRDAETFAAKKKFSLAGEFDYWLSVAAVRLAEGREAEADQAWRRAEDLAHRFPKTGLYEYQRDLLHTVRGRSWLRLPEAVQDEAPPPSSAEPIYASK